MGNATAVNKTGVILPWYIVSRLLYASSILIHLKEKRGEWVRIFLQGKLDLDAVVDTIGYYYTLPENGVVIDGHYPFHTARSPVSSGIDRHSVVPPSRFPMISKSPWQPLARSSIPNRP